MAKAAKLTAEWRLKDVAIGYNKRPIAQSVVRARETNDARLAARDRGRLERGFDCFGTSGSEDHPFWAVTRGEFAQLFRQRELVLSGVDITHPVQQLVRLRSDSVCNYRIAMTRCGNSKESSEVNIDVPVYVDDVSAGCM